MVKYILIILISALISYLISNKRARQHLILVFCLVYLYASGTIEGLIDKIKEWRNEN